MSSFAHFSEFQIALRDEIKAIRKNGGQRTNLLNGRSLGQRGQEHIYSFSMENELHIPDDSRIDLEYQKQRYEGQIISTVGFDLILALNAHIGSFIPSATLYTEPWFLLEELQKRLDAVPTLNTVNKGLIEKLLWDNVLAHKPNTKQAELLLDKIAAGLKKPLHYNSDQLQAIGHVLANNVSYIWGPPGTGKTRTLGMTAASLVEKGESVLILAHSNIAVDVATLSMAQHLAHSPHYSQGRLLRYGVIYASDLKRDAFQSLHVKGVLRQHNTPLIQHIDELDTQREKLTGRLSKGGLSLAERERLQDELAVVKTQLEPLREELKQHENQLLREAVVVACTFSKATIAPQVYERRFDNVIIDEASMAYIPHCVFASSLADKRVAIFGDFRQLAPISQADSVLAKRWLQRDIFDQAGIIAKVNAAQPDPRLTLLSTQYRMHPEIAEIPNELFYQGRLRNGTQVLKQLEPIVASVPNSGTALAYYDLSQLQAYCYQERDSHSRFNLISALTAAELAHQAMRNGSHKVGIITPYNAQTRLINQLLHDLQLPRDQVTAATVHRFQGSECDIIIFDAVEGPPHKPGRVVDGDSDQSLRLANVAVSRARGKFIALAHRDYITSRLSVDNQFRHLLETITACIPIERLQYGFKQTNSLLNGILPGFTFFPNGKQAATLLDDAITQAHDLVAIVWPNTPVRSYHFLLQNLHSSPTKHRRYYISGAGQEQFKPHEMSNRMFWPANKDQKWGFVSLDSRDLWLFLQPEAPQGPVLRLKLPKTVSLLNAFLRLVPDEESRSETIETRFEKGQSPYGTCPRCGNMLYLGDGSYLVCTGGCSYTKRMTVEDANRLIRFMNVTCPDCKSQMKSIQGYNGVYLKCTDKTCGCTRDLSTLV